MRLPPNLLAAYMATTYWAEGPGRPFGLRVGRVSVELQELYVTVGAETAAFLTAFNPLGVIASEEANLRANQALLARLEGHWCCAGEGRPADDSWAPEASYLVLGLSLEAARALAQDFMQNAFVFASNDARPALVVVEPTGTHLASPLRAPKEA